METLLNTFNAGGKFFSHYIDTVTDATFIVDEEEGPQGKRLFSVSSGCVVSDSEDQVIGRFVSSPHRPSRWGFIDLKGKQMWTDHTVDEAEGLLLAERVVFKQMLEAS